MENQLLNPVVILQESLMRLENNLVFFKSVNREYDGSFAVAGEKAGYTVNARIPVRFRGRVGDGVQIEGIQEQMVPITINRLWGQDMEVSDQDLTLTIDRFGDRYVDSSVIAIANLIDGEGCDQYKYIFNQVGTPAVALSDLTPVTAAGVALTNSGCPRGKNRAFVVDPDTEANALGFRNNLFNPTSEISKQYTDGTMGSAVGFKWSMDQNIARHTVGALGTAGAIASNPVVSSANQTGSSITTSGWDASIVNILNEGDIITFAGSNGVNPLSYRDTGHLRTFRVTAPVSSDGSGNATIPIEPDLNADSTSPFQTVTALPANNAKIQVFGKPYTSFSAIASVSSPQSMAFDKNAFVLATVKQEMPGGMEWSEWIANPKIGLGMRLVRGYIIGTNKKITRLDVLGGWKTVRQELACRVAA